MPKFKIPTLEEINQSESSPTTATGKTLFKTHRHVKWDEEDVKITNNETKQLSHIDKTIANRVVQLNKASVTSRSTSTVKDQVIEDTNSVQPIKNVVNSINPACTVSDGGNIASRSNKDLSRSNGLREQVAIQKQGEPIAAPSKPGLPNSIVVNARQRGNPVLKHIRNVPWEFGDIVPDYVLGQTSCALFLSLRYHHLNPNYIHERLKLLGYSYDLRVLLVNVDVKDPHHSLKELAKICILADCTLILAWSPEEAGRYLETYKSYENKPPDLIMEKTETNYLGRVQDCLCTVKKVNKTDASTLVSTFKSVKKIIEADKDELSFCPGFGPQKAQRLYEVFHTPFLKSRKRSLEIDSPCKGKSPEKK